MLRTGWNDCRAKASAAPTSCSPVSDPPWRSSAATVRSRRRRAGRSACREYLEKVWEVVGRAALQQVLGTAEAGARNGMAGALEEDARLTALFLWALQSSEEFRKNSRGGDRAPASGQEDEKEEEVARATARGFHLPFDVVRRFSQPMGIDLDRWTGRIIALKKGVVRLLPIAERAQPLFGSEGSASAANWIETDTGADAQRTLFPDNDTLSTVPSGRRPGGNALGAEPGLRSPDATVLDRVHTAMLLQASGHSNALRTLIASEQERGPDFLRLANALSALYPRGSREKRLLDAMLLGPCRGDRVETGRESTPGPASLECENYGTCHPADRLAAEKLKPGRIP